MLAFRCKLLRHVMAQPELNRVIVVTGQISLLNLLDTIASDAPIFGGLVNSRVSFLSVASRILPLRAILSGAH